MRRLALLFSLFVFLFFCTSSSLLANDRSLTLTAAPNETSATILSTGPTVFLTMSNRSSEDVSVWDSSFDDHAAFDYQIFIYNEKGQVPNFTNYGKKTIIDCSEKGDVGCAWNYFPRLFDTNNEIHDSIPIGSLFRLYPGHTYSVFFRRDVVIGGNKVWLESNHVIIHDKYF